MKKRIVTYMAGIVGVMALFNCCSPHQTAGIRKETNVRKSYKSATQNAVISELIAYGKEHKLDYDLGIGEPSLNHDNPDAINIDGSLWIVPEHMRVSDPEIVRQLSDHYGVKLTFWKYSSKDMKYACYCCIPHEVPFPITSRGLKLHIQKLSLTGIRVEKIYSRSGNEVVEYTEDDLSKIGWNDEGENHYTFTVPPNKTRNNRLWQVVVYGPTDTSRYTQYPIARLNFIQVVDTAYFSLIYNETYRRVYGGSFP
ncbi:MAG: hypothetical protein HDR98_06200 [Bacteroides sp.]|nr:hypothetical protein [Bacteroides sp.]